jgi:GDP-L-fucose synthase
MPQPSPFFENKQVVVTGAAGLLGVYLVSDLLAAGAKVRAVIHRKPFPFQAPNLEVISADLTQEADCEKVMAGMEIACLSASITVGAAQAIHNPMLAVTNNLIMAARSLQAACLASIDRLLLVSSTTVYPAYNYPVREEEAFLEAPHPAYQGVGEMKRYVEKLARFYYDRYGLKIALVRPVPFYGPYDNFVFETCHVIPALIRKAVEKHDPFEIWGTGQDIRDFLHVKDVVAGCLLALEHDPYCDGLNLGSGVEISVKQVAEKITYLAQHDPVFEFAISKPSTIPYRRVDIQKAQTKIGFQPQVSLEQGLLETIEWFRENRQKILAPA